MDRTHWNQFVSSSPHGSFLQSYEWGEMQSRLGVRIWRLETGAAVALVLRRELPLGKSWLYVPRGPIFAKASTGKPIWEEIQKELYDLAEKEHAIFVRIDPAYAEASADAAQLKSSSWRKSEREVQPCNTLVLDLTKSENDLLAAMHHKTRYNIRLAQKKGVTVRFSSDVQDVEHFLKLSRDVSERGAFSFHPDNYYREIITILGQSQMAEVALAEFEGEVLAAHIIISFGDVVTYAHGASSSKSRELMAPHLLQWETIRRAKEKDFKKYDFFGIAPEGADKHPANSAGRHPWSGITRFKVGFGGTRENYVGAFDLVLQDASYHLFNAARRLRSFVR